MTPRSAYPPASSSPHNASSADASRAEAATLDAVLVNAIAQIGKPYQWGGESPQTGFDCSGFIQYVLARAGVSIPRTSFAQAAALPSVRLNHIRPGDLVFFNTMGQPFSHVGIYIGGNQFVSALNRQQGVAVQSLRIHYWAERLDGVRRPMPTELLAMRDK
ncbi:C40 family peptidase [Acidithiobacillus ferrivorans]|uniref:C40 family peptidase n=1 Tax=Acidithiobacillus ferrivorans TaxID=160808 RepID=UPI002100432E|nr:C40 family peptidase [Acidithiobacillus ferrivorans]